MARTRRKLLGIDGGNIFKKGNLTHFLEALGADDVESKLWYGDATVKQDLIVEGRVFGSVSSDTLTEEAQDFKVHRDLIVQDDATVKDTLYVNGPIKGVVEEAQDFWVHKDLIVQDDATVKGQITVEGQGTIYKGLTTDITAAGMKYRVVNGLIVEAVQK